MKWLNPINGEKNPNDWDAAWIQYRLAKKPMDLVRNILLLVKGFYHDDKDTGFEAMKKVKILSNGPLHISGLSTLFRSEAPEDVFEIEMIKLKKKKKKQNNSQEVILPLADTQSHDQEQSIDEVDKLEKLLKEEVLELESIEVPDEVTSIQSPAVEAIETEEEKPADIEEDVDATSQDETIFEIEELDIDLDTEPSFQEEAISDPVVDSDVMEQEALVSFEPVGPSPFTRWINQFSSEKDPLHEKRMLQSKVDNSIEHNQNIISASLAQILAEQGHITEAIDMFERLRLKFPEKSSYFATQIEKLKKL